MKTFKYIFDLFQNLFKKMVYYLNNIPSFFKYIKTFTLTHFHIGVEKLKNLFQIVYNNKRTIMLFIFGLLLISWILYGRFRTRIIQDLPVIFDPFRAILYIGLTLLYAVILLVLIYGLIPKKKSKWMESERILWISGKLMNLFGYYSLAMATVYDQLMNRIPYYGQKLLNKFAEIFLDSVRYHVWIHLIVVVLLPLIPAFFLAIDVFYFYKLNWFYKSLILMLGPLMCRLFLYMLEDLTLPNLTNIQKDVLTVTVEEEGIKFERKRPMTDEAFESWVIAFDECHRLYLLVVDFRDLSQTWYAKLSSFIRLGLYCISWGYLAYVQLTLF